jgi:hypothetical protein
MFQIFPVIVAAIKDPVFIKIEFKWDLEDRRAKIEVSNLVTARSQPVRNSVTDKEQRMITVLPEGWMFHEVQNASGFAAAQLERGDDAAGTVVGADHRGRLGRVGRTADSDRAEGMKRAAELPIACSA